MKEHPLAWKFNLTYEKLPAVLKEKVAAIVNNKHLTWSEIHKEVNRKTRLGYDAIEFLTKIEVI